MKEFFFSAELRCHIAKILASLASAIDDHGLGGNIGTPQANFKRLVNKNAIKHEIGWPPGNFSYKPWPLQEILAKTLGAPPLDFIPCASLSSTYFMTFHGKNIEGTLFEQMANFWRALF